MQRSTRVRGPESTCGVEKIHCNCVLYPSTLWLHLALNDCIAGWMMKRPEMYHYKSDHMAPQSCIRLEQKWHLLFVKRTGKDLLTFWRWGLYIWKEAINPTKLSRHFWEMLGLSMISLFFFFFVSPSQMHPGMVSVFYLDSWQFTPSALMRPIASELAADWAVTFSRAAGSSVSSDNRSGHTLTSRCFSYRSQIDSPICSLKSKGER